MATLQNDRNELLYTSATRVTGATAVISAGTATSLVVPKGATVPFPGTLTLTADVYGYITPTFAWSYRFGDSGNFTPLVSVINTQSVTLDAAWLTAAGTSTLVQYKVVVTETATNGAIVIGINQTEGILSIPILREGVNGVDAINNVVVTLYRRTATNSAPEVLTTGNATYTFSSAQVVGQPANWSQTIPDANGGQYLWTIQTLVASVTGSIAFANNLWTAPVLFSRDGSIGTNGVNSGLAYAYQRSATALSSNPGAVTYNFGTGSINEITLANNWQKTIPSGTDPLYVTIASASSTASTDQILATEWSAPVILSQNGVNSATVYLYAGNNDSNTPPTLSTTGSSIYTFSTGKLSTVAPNVIPSGWAQTLPAQTNNSVTWVVQATAVSTANTDQINNTEWSTPRVLSQNGVDGTSILAYDIITSSQVITKDSESAILPGTYSSITIQGKKYEGNVTTNYGWVTVTANGEVEAATATDTAITPVTLAPTSTAGKSSYTIKLYTQATVDPIALVDTEVINVVFKGTTGLDAVYTTFSNESHVLPAASDGSIVSYTGSGTDIRIYEGTKQLSYDASGLTAGTWKVTSAATNIVAGNIYYVTNVDTITAVLSNQNHIFPTTATGAVSTYVDSGTEIRVYQGAVELAYDGIGTGNGTWKISTTTTNITVGTITDSGIYATVGAHSGVSNLIDTASITYSIIGKDINGTSFAISRTQTFTKFITAFAAIYHTIVTSAPILRKTAPDDTTSGTYSSITIQGKKYNNGVATNYGWATVTANGETEATTAIDTATTPITLAPTSIAGKTSYTIRLYNQATVAGATTLDIQIIPVLLGSFYAKVSDHALMQTSQDTASIIYTITGKNSLGRDFTIFKAQTFTKSKSGANGTNGVRGNRQLYSADALYNSTWQYGTNAPGATSYAVKATDLIAAASVGTIPTSPLQGDTVTFSNSIQKVYSGTILNTVLTVSNAPTNSVVVGQTISGGTIAAGTTIVAQITPLLTGEVLNGVGRYTVSISQSVPTTVAIVGINHYIYTITYNGTAWVTPGTVIDGALLVTGTVTAAKINSNALSIRDADGKIILDAGNSKISGTLSMDAVTGAGFRAGNLLWTSLGVPAYLPGTTTYGKGVAMTPGGILAHNGTNTTFSVDATTGNSTFAGTLNVASALSGARMEIKNETIKVFDSTGSLRVIIGTLP